MAEGLLNVLKPPGMTSHDVVERVRQITRMRRIGHTGTLDPAAAGVMVLMLGQTTRLSEFLTACDKVYRGEITFGIATDTLDGEGTITQRADASALSAAEVEGALRKLTGELQIVPPLHSAVRHEGRRLYEIAREGGEVEVETRPATISRFELLDFTPGKMARALTEVVCSSGTYVRSLAAMLGEIVGLPTYLSFLVRTRVGTQRIEDAMIGAEIVQAMREGRLDEVLIAPLDAMRNLPRIDAERETAVELCRGMQIPAPEGVEPGQHAVVAAPDDRLLCVAEIIIDDEGQPVIQPRRVMLSEDEI